MKRKHKKSCNRFDYGGVISQQVLDLYRDSSGNGIAGAISTSLNGTQKQANGLVKSGYNFNPVASNNDELMDIFSTNRGLQSLGEWQTRDTINNYVKNTLSEVNTGASIGGPWGALVGLATGPITAAIQQHNIKKDIASTNSIIDMYNKRQVAANNNAAKNLATRQKLGFEAGYFRDGGDINYFNNGGTHEQNPFGGIPQGMAPNNQMNVVEEGEVKWESPDGDYIFSNHQRLNKKDITDNLLPNSLKGKTIASAAKSVLKESDERPYDYISTNGKDHFLNILRDINESKNPQNQEVNSFAFGGEPETEEEKYPVFYYWNKPSHGRQPVTERGTLPTRNGFMSKVSRRDWVTGMNPYQLQYGAYPPVQVNTGHSGVRYTSDPEDYLYRGREIYHGPWRMSDYATVQVENPGDLPEEVVTPSVISDTTTNNSVTYRETQQAAPSTNTATPAPKKRSSGMPQGLTGSPATKTTNPTVTAGGETPQAAAGEPAPEVKKREPLIPDVSERAKITIQDALKREQDRALKDALKIDGQKILDRPNNRPKPKEERKGLDWSKVAGVAGKIGDVASALAPLFAAAFDRPNYNYVNEMRNSFDEVDTPYVSSANYMKYTPIDLDYIINQINRQSQSNVRNIMDLSGGNRNTAMAGLFGNDFNTQTAIGNSMLQTALQNLQNYQTVQKHNTGINEFDINQYTTNARFNAQGLAHARQSAAMMGQQEYDAWKDRNYANLSQGLTNLQNLKREGWTDQQIQMLVDSGAIAWDPRTGQYVINNNISV